MSSRPKTLRQSLPGLRRILARLWPYCRQEKTLLATSGSALFATIGLRLLEPWPLKVVLDNVLHGDGKSSGGGALARLLSSMDGTTTLLVAALGVVVVVSLRALAQYLNQVGFAKIGNRVLARVRIDVFAHLQRLSLSYHTSSRHGDLVLRVIQDVNLLRDVAVTAILPLVAKSLILLAMWGVMLWMNWQLTLMAAATLPLVFLRTASLAGQIREAGRQQRRRQGALATTASESIGSIKNVQALSLEGVFLNAFGASNAKSQESDVRSARLSASLGRSVDVLLAVATGLVLFFGARSVLSGRLTTGELLVFLTYLRRAYTPAQDFAKYTGRLAKATAAGERVLEILDRQPEVCDAPQARRAPQFLGAVRFDAVSFGYEPGRPVLRDVSLACEPGQQIALVGDSGAGKSTLISLLLRLYDPDAGRILIDGHDLRDLTLSSLRSQISVVLQDSLLFGTTVAENISYGAAGCSRDEIEAAARLANAEKFILDMPDGFDTVVGERGVTLSGGQRQRLAIARAAVRKAPILIFDEPTTGLDEGNQQEVLEALRRLGEGRTTFWIAHNLELSRRADLIFFVADSTVSERGTHRQLMADGGSYADLFRLQGTARGRPREVASGV